MSPTTLYITIISYITVLILISHFTGKGANSSTFFTAKRNSRWYVFAFGMIGASLSGVTFISVPGWVRDTGMSYMPMVLGYFFGYLVIANVLLPVYYKNKLTSIYEYLGKRFGEKTHKSGSAFFLLSRTIGAGFRLFLMMNVLQLTVFDRFDIPFGLTVVVALALIFVYTFRGGMKTIIWTDVLQTAVILIALVITIWDVCQRLDFSLPQAVSAIVESPFSKMVIWDDWQSANHVLKQFISGIFITIVMTGLDQDMMQKNLTCKNLGDAQKNIKWYGFAFVPANLLFLSLGTLLLLFAQQNGITLPERSDDIYPLLATGGYLSPVTSIVFLIGLLAAAYSSADSALASLTTAFSYDFINIQEQEERKAKRTRITIHFGFAVILTTIILVFNALNDQSVIASLFQAAGNTYGPLLGIFAIGILTKWQLKDKMVPLVMLVSPFLTFGVKVLVESMSAYKFGFELLMINGAITFLLCWLLAKKA
ncbi:MAG: sodium:solute symporter [Bacteroidales bacterium]|jgi:SSS family solute:Na+ symporter|nr:sodium:solute symporter [Bacteroidales bacterium]